MTLSSSSIWKSSSAFHDNDLFEGYKSFFWIVCASFGLCQVFLHDHVQVIILSGVLLSEAEALSRYHILRHIMSTPPFWPWYFWSPGQFNSIQLLSHVQFFVTPWTAACHVSLSITNSWSWLKLMSTELVMWSHHLILCCVLLLPLSIFPSISVFSNESVLHIRWPKYWSFSFSFSPSNDYSGLISFRMDWLDLLAVQGTLKSLLQHHSSKASVLRSSIFLMVQLSHPYMITGKTIALTRWTFVGTVVSQLFNMLSRFVIAFLPRRKHLLISWLQSPSTVILEPQKTNLSLFPLLPHLCAMKWWGQMPWS